jgi:menaquinone-dependent protoporphyrinogen oxidase
MPVWAFSSGPLNHDAAETDIPPTEAVRAFLDSVDARGHVTFGGRLVDDPGWFPASSMSDEMAGDWRDRTAVVGWATGVGEELRALEPSASG